MAAYIRQRPAGWFWLVGVAITFWGSAGCAAWIAARAGLAFAAPDAPPGWAFAVAAGALLIGGVALLNKKLIAGALFAVALVAALTEGVLLLTANGALPGEGVLTAIVLAVAALLVWFAGYSRRHGWIS